MAERTFESEKNRLIKEGADPNLFDVFIIQKLLTKLIQDPWYGSNDSNGNPEIVHVNPDNTGTFNIRTQNIDGYTMSRFQSGDIIIQKIEITHHKRVIDYDTEISYGKRKIP